ncbi:hypothetical protein DI09_30p240 [Mitosporidium daphniae]|uniref:Uncharacterized protein n=1 Tax=Mitosporidium daphniae TaxID=1485682 RepID=A0A098VRD1_9MICR|nr:uncharacterized protein DI09_30p240 [Mitosporidium daphniae]KGG51608.1 hypothetical protein DI09_30p240 [Mitosporidium daphniae]|eukprot:XP_013238035.1 uncharacterized protein DI09_30p240 [Mitosporidium daphniae]
MFPNLNWIGKQPKESRIEIAPSPHAVIGIEIKNSLFNPLRNNRIQGFLDKLFNCASGFRDLKAVDVARRSPPIRMQPGKKHICGKFVFPADKNEKNWRILNHFARKLVQGLFYERLAAILVP